MIELIWADFTQYRNAFRWSLTLIYIYRQRIVEQSRRVLEEAKLCCLHKNLYRFTTRTLVINTVVFLVFYFVNIIFVHSLTILSTDTFNQKESCTKTKQIQLQKFYKGTFIYSVRGQHAFCQTRWLDCCLSPLGQRQMFGTKVWQNALLPTKVLIIIQLFFSSPELKTQVSFSDPLSHVVRLSINFSHFNLLLQNHFANFNQTWHKASLGEGDSTLFNFVQRRTI